MRRDIAESHRGILRKCLHSRPPCKGVVSCLLPRPQRVLYKPLFKRYSTQVRVSTCPVHHSHGARVQANPSDFLRLPGAPSWTLFRRREPRYAGEYHFHWNWASRAKIDSMAGRKHIVQRPQIYFYQTFSGIFGCLRASKTCARLLCWRVVRWISSPVSWNI